MFGGCRYLRGLSGRGYFTLAEPRRRGRRVQRILHGRWEQVWRRILRRIQSITTDGPPIRYYVPALSQTTSHGADGATQALRRIHHGHSVHMPTAVYSYVPQPRCHAVSPRYLCRKALPGCEKTWALRRGLPEKARFVRAACLVGPPMPILGSAPNSRRNRRAHFDGSRTNQSGEVCPIVGPL